MKKLLLLAIFVGASSLAHADACDDATRKLGQILSTISIRPQGWHWRVPCSDELWREDVRHFSSHSDKAFTIRGLKLTVIRMNVLENLGAENIVRHEIGHILCDCDDENLANKRGNE